MTLDSKFGKLLREQRKLRGLTQSDLALRAGITVRYVGKLEHGLASPTLDCYVKLASALGVSAVELMVLLFAQDDSKER